MSAVSCPGIQCALTSLSHQPAGSLIREFEREARLDGLSPEELAARRKQLVQELNGFIGLKKAYAHGHIPGRDELMQVGPSGLPTQDTSTVSDLMVSGRKAIKETDASLLRSERIVNDTVAVGAQTAETLQLQGQQLGKVWCVYMCVCKEGGKGRSEDELLLCMEVATCGGGAVAYWMPGMQAAQMDLRGKASGLVACNEPVGLGLSVLQSLLSRTRDR